MDGVRRLNRGYGGAVTSLLPADDARAADWVAAALTTFGESVLSLVPSGFPSYVRVFHAAYRVDRRSGCRGERWSAVSWAEIAAANGARAHAGMQLGALTGSDQFIHGGQPDVYDHPPMEGSLPAEIALPLREVLARHTTTPERCWFAVWNGCAAAREDVRGAPTFRVPSREYHLLSGPIEAVIESLVQGRVQSPNIWWPDDHAWCVATEIDLNITYLACSGACRDDLLADPGLEARQIEPTTGISWVSDLLNKQPKAGAPTT